MSYLVLARKYRPQTFADVVGQAPIVKTLRNSLLRRRIAHAILFSGVRGVGKTTLARIMAKAINCSEQRENRPCNACPSCQQIAQGRSLDLHEIDGASNRGIQEIRELKEKLRFMPTSSKYKIIIIDEVHMLTTEAFNALLKTLEEPPAHVYFMFATTELHKIPITILSRCQRYELKRVAAAELNDHFAKIAAAEEVKIEPAALSVIVREAEGSVRDGLSLLDQMFSFGDAEITHDDVIQVLGLTDRNLLMTITEALLAGNRAVALTSLEGAFDYGVDIRRFSADLLECFRTLLLVKVEGCGELLDLPQEEVEAFGDLASGHSFETIHSKLGLLMRGTEELRHAAQPRLTLETAFLRIIEAGNIVSVHSLLGKVNELLAGVPETDEQAGQSATEKKTPQHEPEKKSAEITAPLSPPLPEEPPPPDESSQPEAAETYGDSGGDGDSDGVVPRAGAAPPRQEKPEPGIIQHAHTRDVRKDWIPFTDYVKERKVWMAQDLQRADTVKEKEGELHLHYSDAVVCTLLRNKENRKLLTEFVLDFFQKDLTVRFIVPETGANGEEDDDAESPHRQRQQLARDPLVQMAVEIFNGQLGDIRVGPRSR